MGNRRKLFGIISLLMGLMLIQTGCKKQELQNNNPPDENYISEILNERASKDSSFQFDSHSPFNSEPKVRFSSLNYYDPTGEFIFKSKLYEYNPKDTVDVYGTKGELRRIIMEGYVVFNYSGEEHRINIYKGVAGNGQVYYSIWFTDKTTGNETYGVGRYLDFEKEENTDHIYTIDFNKAYNPYCAYNAVYTCAIPRKEDFIDIKIEAGEKNFH